jgi:DNA-binding CsgD family transcriptional regulator
MPAASAPLPETGDVHVSEPSGLDDSATLVIARERIARLSHGQLSVVRLVGQHMNSKEIAAQLGISPHTVDQRVRAAIRLLGVTRRQEAARLVALVEGPYQPLIHQPPVIDAAPVSAEPDGAIGFQIRHADRTGETGKAGLETEEGTVPRSLLLMPWATRSNPRNALSVGQRLLWIVLISMGATSSAGMYLAGLESLARLVRS